MIYEVHPTGALVDRLVPAFWKWNLVDVAQLTNVLDGGRVDFRLNGGGWLLLLLLLDGGGGGGGRLNGLHVLRLNLWWHRGEGLLQGGRRRVSSRVRHLNTGTTEQAHLL